ncbi:MAG: hypothetical protein V2A79_00810, partial [Planctomycetota bacterium]
MWLLWSLSLELEALGGKPQEDARTHLIRREDIIRLLKSCDPQTFPMVVAYREEMIVLTRISQMPLFLMARYVHVFPVIRRVFGHFDRSTPWVTGENKHFVCS